MARNKGIASDASTGAPVVGFKTDVYERQMEMVWMSKDDIEHFESRLNDKVLFQKIALFLLSASIPLLVEKYIDFNHNGSQTDLAVVIVCVGALAGGLLFQFLASRHRKRIQSFKADLFMGEKKLSTTISMVDTSDSSPRRRSTRPA